MGIDHQSAEIAPRTVSLADEEGVKRILIDTLFGLWATVNNLTRLQPSRRERYRVSIFGSARTQPGHWVYGEVKRMWVRPAFRGRGYGKLVLDHLGDYAKRHGIGILRLETGIHQHAAIHLYEREGFQRIPPFGPYREDPVSLCYEKRIP